MITTLATLTLVAAASAPAPLAPADGHAVQIRAKTVLVGDGSRLEDALVVVADGKIQSIGKGTDADASLPLYTHDGVLSAGIVVGQTRSGAASEGYDEARTMMPTARIAYAFSPDHSDFEKALASGITSLVLAPTAENVVGGLTAVVKSHGGAVVSPDAQLAVSFAQIALSRGDTGFGFFFGSAEQETLVPLSADGGPENTSGSARGARTPTSYTGAVRALNTLFDDGADGPVARAKSGALPVLLEAWDRNEVTRALKFASAHGLRGALRGAPLAGDPHVLAQIKASGLGVIVGPFASGHRRRSLEGVAKLQEAGVPVAFALDAPTNHPEAVRMSAVMAVQAGADVDKTWSALTGDAAKLAGVDARVGLVAAGRDADLVLWSGHPLDLTSRVEAVWVDGHLAHSADSSK